MNGTQLWSLLTKCLFFVCSLEPLVADGFAQTECQADSFRLPRRVRPEHYELTLKVDLSQMLFSGRVEIDLKHDRAAMNNDVVCRGLTDKGKKPLPAACDPLAIVLHASPELLINNVHYVDRTSGDEVVVRELCRDSKSSQVVVKLQRAPNMEHPGRLVFSFSGEINEEGDTGLYASSNTGTQKGQDKPMIVTQFESGHARNVFPLFDEPDFKATFTLTILHPEGLRAVSNVPAVSEELVYKDVDKQNYVEVKFDKTPTMSSYLLAFAVGQFDRIEKTIMDGNMTIGMFTPPGRGEDAREHLENAARAYQALLEYFKIQQPIKKIDFVAVDKFDGAMENWGMVTFETVHMLNGEREKATHRDHSFALQTVTHELAHHWFGNLVTMKWWDDLWLNEGFACWIASKLCQVLHPETSCELTLLTGTMAPALIMDGDVDLTHPIKNNKLKTIEEIEESFDAITYQKAHCVIRMLNEYIGDEKFQKGIQSYITKHMYGNTEADDLWAALKESSGLDVEPLVESWIHQEGHPLVEANLDSENKQLLHLRQVKFATVVKNRKMFRKKSSLIKWRIPIAIYVTNGAGKSATIKLVMGDFEDSVKLPRWFDVEKPGHWLKVNSRFEGFYRVHYGDPSLMSRLSEGVRTKTMEPADRLNLVDDARALYYANIMSEKELLGVVGWYEHEHDDAVILSIVRLFSWLTDGRAKDLEQLAIVRNYYQRTGGVTPVQNEQDLRLSARLAVARFLLGARDARVIQDSIDLYKSLNGNVPASMQSIVYPAVAVGGDEQQLLEVLDKVNNIESESSRSLLSNYVLAALADTDRRNVAESVLGETVIRTSPVTVMSSSLLPSVLTSHDPTGSPPEVLVVVSK